MKTQALSVVAMALLLTACASPPPARPADAVASPAAKRAVFSTDEWLGEWTGPEGTFLRLDGGGNDYLVTIRNLDRTRTFLGTRQAGSIQFERDGKLERIRHTTGKETGMKWLADYSDCLTVKKGEGYCRSPAVAEQPASQHDATQAKGGTSKLAPASAVPAERTRRTPAEPSSYLQPDAIRQAPVGVGEEPDLSALKEATPADASAAPSGSAEPAQPRQTPWGNPGSMAQEDPGF